MKRGEVWTVAGGTDYAGKPRPAIVIQDDPKSKLGTRLGRIDDDDLLRLNQAVIVFLGLAGSASERRP